VKFAASCAFNPDKGKNEDKKTDKKFRFHNNLQEEIKFPRMFFSRISAGTTDFEDLQQ
jgi:hypothetical protein